MKTFSKILLAAAGIMLVPASLLMAWIKRFLPATPIFGGDNVFVYSQVIWDEVWQRPQQYTWLTAARHQALYCAPVQMHNLLYLKKKWKPVRHIHDGGRRLLVLSPLVFSGHFKSRIIHEINCWIIAQHLKLALRNDARLWTLVNTPFALRVIQKMPILPQPGAPATGPAIARLIYDVIDDFTVFDWSPPFGTQFDVQLTALAHATIAGTHELASARPETPFIPCGVDFDLFSKPVPPPAELAKLPRPIIGYFGTISERIDLHLIEKIAREFPETSIVMVGPVHFPSEVLPRNPNIHYLGLRRHTELPAFAQHYDIGLIPFRITEATTRLNPVKTLEYLAAGLPVVATALPDLQRYYADVVHLAHTHEEFIEHVRHALTAKDDQRIQTGIARARDASWQAMADEMNRILFSSAATPPSPAQTSASPASPRPSCATTAGECAP